MAFLYSKNARRIVLILIALWSLAAFWFLNQMLFDRIIVFALGFAALLFIIFEVAPIFILIFLSFSSAYALYGFLFIYNLPNWLIMLAMFLIFGYLFVYTEQKTGILSNRRLIYLLLFSILMFEIFLALSFFLINPLSQSLVIASVSYLFVGFCYTILAKHRDSSIITYIVFSLIAILAVLLFSTWGGNI